jgi:hypothetical protein
MDFFILTLSAAVSDGGVPFFTIGGFFFFNLFGFLNDICLAHPSFIFHLFCAPTAQPMPRGLTVSKCYINAY